MMRLVDAALRGGEVTISRGECLKREVTFHVKNSSGEADSLTVNVDLLNSTHKEQLLLVALDIKLKGLGL